jgi:hypothetical protein
MTSPLDSHSLIEQKKALEELASDRAFLHLNSLVQAQVDALQQEILFSPCSNVDSLVSQEYKKGQLEGRLSWARVLETAIANLTLDIQYKQEEEENGGSDDRTP